MAYNGSVEHRPLLAGEGELPPVLGMVTGGAGAGAGAGGHGLGGGGGGRGPLSVGFTNQQNVATGIR